MVLALAGDSTTRTFIPAALDLWAAYLGSRSRMTRRGTAEQGHFRKIRRDTDGRGTTLSTPAGTGTYNFWLNKFLILPRPGTRWPRHAKCVAPQFALKTWGKFPSRRPQFVAPPRTKFCCGFIWPPVP